jgi:GR25 family glycosyltransferase involved in LPS biosynthesis
MEATERWLGASVGDREISAVVLGSGHAASVLAECCPAANVLLLEHRVSEHLENARRWGGDGKMTVRHAILDGPLPWYDCREIEFPAVDLLVIGASAAERGDAVRAGAVCLRRHLKSGARIVLDGGGSSALADEISRWLATGGIAVEASGDGLAVLVAAGEIPWSPAFPSGGLAEVAERMLVISLPEREDRREKMRENWAPQGWKFQVIDGVRVEPGEIRWGEMKGMEAYGKAEHLRGDYVVGAVGCKRAGIKALREFIESGADTALICQDDCLWRPDAARTVERALRELPDDWDLLYFSASSREKNTPYSPRLMRLGGARYCNAILWRRSTALRLLPELEGCDCEWDLFMQRSQNRLNAYCVVPMPAYQGKSRSDIVRAVVEPPNG